MTTSGVWYNADGLQVRYGGYWTDATQQILARDEKSFGETKIIVYDVDLTKVATGTTTFTTDRNNDGTLDGFNDGDVYLPKNASVQEVVCYTLVAATGGTSFTLGTYQQDGTAIGATSLVTATEGVIANINAVGKRTYGAGSLVSTSVGTAGVGTVAAYIGLAGTGTFTAGKVRFIIKYIAPLGDAVS